MRTTYNFNEGWSFGKPGEEAFPVTLPHTWNAVDGLVKMAAGAITPEMVVELNQKLCKIRK